MIENKTELAEMISTRISHDLIGNIGALSDALELIKENNNQLDADTLGILETAARTLKARQTFFRIAFGLDTKSTSADELVNMCRDYLATTGSRTRPLTAEFEGVSPKLAKYVCLGVMTGAEVCVRGGNIKISVSKENMTVSVSSEYNLSAQKIGIYKDILQNTRPQDNISQYVQLIYLLELLGTGVKVQLAADDKTMKIVFA